MDFKRIPVVLKRYDFKSKMAICEVYSKNVMSNNGMVDASELIDKPLPWELEAFALFSVISFKEYSNNKFEDKKNNKRFMDIIASIRNYELPKLKNAKKSNEYVNYFMIVTGLNQFSMQESLYYKIYRYSYLFNFKNTNIDMKKRFLKKFGYSYEEFKELGIIINFFFANKIMDEDIYSYILRKYKHIVQILLKNRDEYIELQKKVTYDIDQYIYGFKYFYQFPFISYNQVIFLPLPHLIIHSITSSLLFRLTEGDARLREVFGKETLESYIVHLCSLSKSFDEVLPEYSYKYKGNEKRTSDVMVRRGKQCFLLDSKSMTPRVSLRDLTEKDVEHTINRLVSSVIQVYKHITECFKTEYYPFEEEINFLKEDIFGAVVVFEDSFALRDIIMKKAAEKLKIDNESTEYKYLCSNVKLLSLYEIETMIFKNYDVFQLLSKNRDDNNKWFDYTLIDYSHENDEIPIEEINQIIKETEKNLAEFSEELLKEGVISGA
ncbi:hypothetical protein BMG_6086 (plasmid) [Priestia megaterium]|uniref:hypothetical protein n=2 Tax=Priestia megaterium TaxID=1404 RepID=UPI0015DBDC9D|nr:hypothetical protein [Priestia megaterium]QLK09314.1 hypothetical protein BMG_6086 [Priestia megaterium]